jgi:hypothetical protein
MAVSDNKEVAEDDEIVPQKFSIRRKYLTWLRERAKERHVPVSTILDEVLDQWMDAQAMRASHDATLTGHELLEEWIASGLIGLWKDRSDIGDSVEYARHLRETVWKREHD